MNSLWCKWLVVVLIFSLSEKTFCYLNNLPEPYCQLNELLPFNDHGWYSSQDSIEKMFRSNKISKVVEIGSGSGLSTIHIASLLPDDGILYAVDSWDKVAQYDQFLSNIIHSNLCYKIKPLKITVIEALEQLKLQDCNIDMIYFNSSDNRKLIFNDLNVFYYFMLKQGNCIFCGDDWVFDSVKNAVRYFARNNSLKLYCWENFWFLKSANSKILDNAWQVL